MFCNVRKLCLSLKYINTYQPLPLFTTWCDTPFSSPCSIVTCSIVFICQWPGALYFTLHFTSCSVSCDVEEADKTRRCDMAGSQCSVTCCMLQARGCLPDKLPLVQRSNPANDNSLLNYIVHI